MAPSTPTPSDDWHAVETLIMTYAERVDLGDFAGVAALFEHATYRAEHGGQIVSQEGAPAVLATFEGMVRRYDDGTPRTPPRCRRRIHRIHNPGRGMGGGRQLR